MTSPPRPRYTPDIPPHPGHQPDLITHEELPAFVPGAILCASDDLNWKGLTLRTYVSQGMEVVTPPMDCFAITRYEAGQCLLNRRIGTRWSRGHVEPGRISLLSRAIESEWVWNQTLQVSHVYLDNRSMLQVAREMRDADVTGIELHDILDHRDPVVNWITDRIKQEAHAPGTGTALYASGLMLQLAAHLLRHYSSLRFQEAVPRAGKLSAPALARLRDYVDAHLADPLSIQDLARIIGVGPWTLNRRLRATLGCSAVRFLMDRRLERARGLIAGSSQSLSAIAAATGFSDQAHMTRVFKTRLGITPGQYRSQSGNVVNAPNNDDHSEWQARVFQCER